jgi:hypothetical protein
MSSILKTGDLIRSIKRRAFIPSSQETFTDEDFLEMATEEINLGLVPLIQKMHEEHLVYYVDIDIERGKRRYAIPARAYGNKLRDVALLDENDNLFEMHRYSLSEISDFTNTTVYINTRGFYLENNDVILANFEQNIGQKLRFYFYLRPNILVKEEDGAKIQTITSLIEEDFINPNAGSISNIQSSGLTTIITSNNHGLKSGSKVQISASNSIPAINGIYEVFNITTNSFSIGTSIITAGNAGSWKLMLEVYQFQFLEIPDKFLENSQFDFTQKESPNKIVAYDIFSNRIDQNVKIMTFPKTLLGEVSVGDYITVKEETIVPNIPTELHPILAQRVAIACLEAMGDEQNKQSAERKLATMERDAGTFLDNRVEGATQKIKSRHSPLVNTLNTLGRRNRRW